LRRRSDADPPTVERLRALGLAAMADAFMELQNAPDAGELSREDWLGLLVDREATSARTSALPAPARSAAAPARRRRGRRFPRHRGLDRALFRKLATCEWIREHHHLVMIGPTGIGKSCWLALLGHKACARASRYSTSVLAPVRRSRPGAREGPAGRG